MNRPSAKEEHGACGTFGVQEGVELPAHFRIADALINEVVLLRQLWGAEVLGDASLARVVIQQGPERRKGGPGEQSSLVHKLEQPAGLEEKTEGNGQMQMVMGCLTNRKKQVQEKYRTSNSIL